ncbi:MAG: transglycosylase domain-containing protein, partial [Longimonas sp.]|uniref:transglycosylase domain-containing protein n=1 Tax=Longimonas sp. TaxID=2039626 RepID=UPI00335467FD
MSDQWSYSDGELEEYFENPERRSSDGSSPTNDNPPEHPEQASSGAGGSASEDGPLWVGWAGRWIENPRLAQAVSVLGVIAGIGLAGILLLVSIFASLRGDIPSTQRLENPSVDLATIAYTSDGEELARYARQNRSWLPYDSIGTNVINALVATEDHRFHRHWGVDLQGVAAAAFSSLTGNLRGASTIS